jgi:hypothetical protein
MLALRAFLERKNQDCLHTLKGERRKERDAVNASRGCQNHSTDAGSAHAKSLVLRGRTIDVFTP